MKTKVPSPQAFATGDGRTIYLMCIEVFPGFFGNVYLIDDGSRRILVDTGSGMEFSNQNLDRALASLTEFGVLVGLEHIDVVLITHGHMDHFGGVNYVRQHSKASVGVHILDRRVLSHYEERVVVASQQLRNYLQRCGLSANAQAALMTMYTAPKHRYHSMPVDFVIEEGAPVIAPSAPGEAGARGPQGGDLQIDVIAVPGHCPGQVCLKLGEVLLTADHVLARITPHQSPESITLNTGLQHYLDSLQKLKGHCNGVRVGLGGHEQPIADVASRIEEIERSHQDRLEKILDSCTRPMTTAELSRELFGSRHGYDVLLALEEAGAHVEYLYIRGDLVAANLEELEAGPDSAVRYERA